MKILYQLFISSTLVALVGCNSKNKTSETNKSEIQITQKAITFADFKKIKGVDNIQDVPFQLFTKLDSVQFLYLRIKMLLILKKLTTNSIIIMDLKNLMASTLFISVSIIIFRTALKLLF
nr:hypothetical protein [Elizabethkingia bruuniana]